MIDRNGVVPLYQQIKQALRAQIAEGTYRMGERIPSEQELSRQFGVSRITTKQAITELVREGLLRRVQGKGTFVARPKIEQRLRRVFGFVEEMEQKGARPSTLLSDVSEMPCPEIVAEWFHGQRVFQITRVRAVDDEPLAIQTAFLPTSILPGFAASELDEAGSLYRLLDQKYGLRPVRGREQYTIAFPNAREAQLLQIRSSDPVFHVRRVSWDKNGRVVEVVFSKLRGDRYSFEVDLAN